MSIKNLLLVASMLLAFGSVSSWAASHEKAAESTEEVECIEPEDLEAMSAEDRAKQTLPVCEDVEDSTEMPKVEKKAD